MRVFVLTCLFAVALNDVCVCVVLFAAVALNDELVKTEWPNAVPRARVFQCQVPCLFWFVLSLYPNLFLLF